MGEPLWECVKSALLARHGRSLIIFDWDDTLFPTTALEVGGHFDFPKLEPPVEIAGCMAAAVRVLRYARSLGTTPIVTNSDHGWVHETAAKFFPSLSSELVDIPVISARSIFKPQGIADPKQRKVLCFQRIVQCFQSGPAGFWGVQSLVSIGDSIDEQEASMMVARSCPCYVKSLKLMLRPTMPQLAQQLEAFTAHLAPIATLVGNLDVDLGQMVQDEGILAEDVLKEQVRASSLLGQTATELEKRELASDLGTSPCRGEPEEKKRRLFSWAETLGA